MIPPQAIEIEKAVLGTMIVSPESIPMALRFLTEENFYVPNHQRYFKAIKQLHEERVTIDSITIIQMLKEQAEALPEDAVEVTKLTMATTGASNIEYHCHVLIEKFIARSIISIGKEYEVRAHSDTEDILDLLDEAENKLRGLTLLKIGKFSPTKQIGEGVAETVLLLEEMVKGDGKHIKKFYFPEIDCVTGGMMRGNMVVIAAKDKRGKTSLALQILYYNALNKFPSCVFSQEMSFIEIQIRLAIILADIKWVTFLEGKLTPQERLRFYEKLESLKTLPIYVNDRMNSIHEIEDEMMAMKQLHDIQLGAIDYIQLVKNETRKGTNSKVETREGEVSSVSRAIKTMAKEIDIPILAMCQLNKDMNSRESMAIQMDMDKMISIDDKEIPAGIDVAEVGLRIRQRFGPGGNFGDIKLGYHVLTGSWRTLTTEGLVPPQDLGF